MSWSKIDEGFSLPRKIRDQIKHVTFGGSPGEERALITTLDRKLHISSANFLSNDQGRNVTSLPDNITHAALNWNNTLAQVRRTSGGRGNMPVRRHQVHSRVQRGRAEQVRLVVTSIENGLFTSTPTTCKLPSEGDIVLIQWISVDELVIVVKQNSEYQIFFWCTTLKHEYTLITRTLVGEEETIFSDFIISPDGKYNLLVSNNGMLLFSSDTEDDNPTLPLVVRKIDAEAASFMNSGGPSSVLVTATFERPVITVTARELLSPNSDSTIRVLGRTFEHEIVPLNLDEVGVRFLHFLQDGTGFLLTENTLYVVNIDPSLKHLTTPFKEFTYYDISGAVHIRSDSSSSPNTNTLNALAFRDKKKTALLFCTLTVHYDTTPSESTGNHSTLSNENETLSTSSNNVGFEPTGELVRVASPSGSTANNGPPLEPPAKTPEKLEAEKLNSSEDEDNVSDSRTPPQNNSERGVDVPPSTSLVTQRSQREFSTTVSLGMDPPIDQSDGSGNTQQAEKEEDLLANEDIGINTAESLHSSSLNHEVGTEISTTDALAVDSGEQETPLRSPTSSSDAPAPDSSNSEGQTTNANAKAIVNPFEVEEDDDAIKSSRSTSPAGSPRASVSAKSIGAPKSAADDGLKNSQLSTPKRSGSPSNPLPFQTKSSSFELDDASVASDGSKAIELTTNDHRFEDAAKAVGVSPQDGSAINGASLLSPEKQTPPHHHLHQRETVVSHVEKPEEPRLPRMNRLQVAQDSSINLNATNSEFDSSSSSEGSIRVRVPYYGAALEGDVDQDSDSAEESSFSNHDHDEQERDQDSNALSEDNTGTDVSDSDKTDPLDSDDAARLYLRSLKGEGDESSEDNEDLDEDAAEKSSGENGRVLNVASPPPAAVAKMEVISISSDSHDGFNETEKATIHAHVDEVYHAFNIIHPNEQMTVEHTQCLVAQRLRIDREALSQEQENLVRQRVEHWLGGNNDDVENEVAGETGGASALENHQGSVPGEVQHDNDAIPVYSSDDDEVSSTTDPTNQQILDFVDSRFEIADLDKVSRNDFQRQAVKHFFGVEDRNALGIDRKKMIKARVNELFALTSTQRDSLEDEDDEEEQFQAPASSSTSSEYVQSNESESEGDEDVEAEGNSRGRTDPLIYSGPWEADETWLHQIKKYKTKKAHFFTSPGRHKFTTKKGADTFRQIVQNEANGDEVIAIQIFVRQSHKGYAGMVDEQKVKKQRNIRVP